MSNDLTKLKINAFTMGLKSGFIKYDFKCAFSSSRKMIIFHSKSGILSLRFFEQNHWLQNISLELFKYALHI